jgi:methanethiol S-methyltransferase
LLQLLYAWLGAAAFVASLAYFLFAYVVTFGETTASGDTLPRVAINVGLFTAFALHHSLFARTPLKQAVRSAVSPPMERTLYTWISSILFAAVCVLWQPVPGVLYSVAVPWSWIGYAAEGAGILLTVVGSRALDVLDLAGVRPVLDSQRSTAEPRHVPLQTGGVYGLVRHPLYFGWFLFVFGAPHMTMTRFVFACVSTAYLAVAIPFEERALVDTFGPDYRGYQHRVRWRMLPFVY